MPMLRRFSMGCTVPTSTVKPTKAEEDNISVVSTDYGYEPMLGLATPSSKPVKKTQSRRRSSLNHVPMTMNSDSNQNKSPSVASKQFQEALSSRNTNKTKRRSSMGTITSCPATTAAGHARQAKRRSSTGTTTSAAALPPVVGAGPPETRRQRRLRRASLGDNTNNSNRSLPITSHVHVVNLQASWQRVNDATRHTLAEIIVWRLLEADATLRRYKWRITSFSSPKLSQLTRLLVETLEVLVSHAGPDLDTEVFDEWRAQWTLAGLPGPSVARVLVESLQELAAATTAITTTTTTSDEMQDEDKNDDGEPATVATTMWNDPNVLEAWECTIVPVLKEWE